MTLWLLIALGCEASISGEVDGGEPGGGESFFVEEPGHYGNGDDRVRVIIADVPDACVEYAQLLDEIDDIDIGDLLTGDFDDVENWWAATFPEDWWLTTVNIRAEDLSGDLTVTTFDGADSGAPGEAGDASVDMVHYTAHQTVSGMFSGDDQRTYSSTDGSLEVKRWTPSESIKGRFDTTMEDSGGDAEGEVSISFNATHCPEAQAEL